MRRILIAAVAVALTGCSNSNSPEGVAKQYLKAAQAGDSEAIAQLECNDHIKELPQIQEWEITGTQQATDPVDSNATYTLVLADLTTVGAGSIPVQKTWAVEVWESEALYQSNLRTTEQINQGTQKANELTGGNVPLLPVPERSNISSDEYCVIMLVER